MRARRWWLHLATIHFIATHTRASTLHACDGRASFRVTEDGGTAFGGAVRVARWQPGKKIELDWGGNGVRLRPESVEGGAKLLEANAHGATFKQVDLPWHAKGFQRLEVAAIDILEDLANLRLRRISPSRRVGCWSPVPILDAVLNTGVLQDRRVVVLSSDGGPPWLAQGV